MLTAPWLAQRKCGSRELGELSRAQRALRGFPNHEALEPLGQLSLLPRALFLHL